MTSSLKLLLVWPHHQDGGTWNCVPNKPIISQVTFIWIYYQSNKEGNGDRPVQHWNGFPLHPTKSSYVGPAHVLLSTSRSSSICLCYQATWEVQLLFDIVTILDFVNADFPLSAVLGEGLVESFCSWKTYLLSLQEGTHHFLMNWPLWFSFCRLEV